MAIVRFNKDNHLTILSENSNENQMWNIVFDNNNQMTIKSLDDDCLNLKYVNNSSANSTIEINKKLPIAYHDLEKIVEKFCHNYTMESPEIVHEIYKNNTYHNRIFAPEKRPIISMYFDCEDNLIIKLFLDKPENRNVFQDLYRKINTCIKKRKIQSDIKFKSNISFCITNVSNIGNIGKLISKALKAANIIDSSEEISLFEKNITNFGIQSVIEHEISILKQINYNDIRHPLHKYATQISAIIELFQSILDKKCDMEGLTSTQRKTLRACIMMIKPFENLPPHILMKFSRLRSRFSSDIHKKLNT